MPKVKTLIVVLFVITFAFSLLGCDLITSRTASTDEVVEMGGQVPEWLTLSHRSIASEERDLVAIDEEDKADETGEAVDGVDADTADTGQTEQATSEVAQAAENGNSGSTQQESSNQEQPSSSGDTVSDIVAKIVPGTREYNEYMRKREPGETPEQWVERELKDQENDADAEEEDITSPFEDWGDKPSWLDGN